MKRYIHTGQQIAQKHTNVVFGAKSAGTDSAVKVSYSTSAPSKLPLESCKTTAVDSLPVYHIPTVFQRGFYRKSCQFFQSALFLFPMQLLQQKFQRFFPLFPSGCTVQTKNRMFILGKIEHPAVRRQGFSQLLILDFFFSPCQSHHKHRKWPNHRPKVLQWAYDRFWKGSPGYWGWADFCRFHRMHR